MKTKTHFIAALILALFALTACSGKKTNADTNALIKAAEDNDTAKAQQPTVSEESAEDFDSFIKDKTYLPVEYLAALKGEDRNILLKYNPQIESNSQYHFADERDTEWYENGTFRYMQFFMPMDLFLGNSFFIKIYESQRETSGYIIKGKQTDYSKKSFKGNEPCLVDLSPLENFDTDDVLRIEIDGDYITCSVANRKFSHKYFLADKETYNQIKLLLTTNACDLSKVTWPRHADGTCDYEEANGNATAGAGDFEDRLNKGFWVRNYYNEVIQKKDRNVFLDYVPVFKEKSFDFYEHLGYELYWYEELNRLGDVCHDFYSEPNDEHCLFLLRRPFAVEEITKLKDCCYRIVTRDIKIDSAFIAEAMYEGCDWSLLKDKSEIQLYVEFDGDYLFIYTDEAKTLLATYCMYEKNEYNSFLEAVKTNDFDGMEFTFPRHADGSCDYDEGAWKAARKSGGGIPLRTGKAITTKENLRVHSFEKTTSPVLITLAAGTPVEILGVGGEETIDGITSKWVHVMLAPGTTGTDGRHMTGTMGGWCFGGLVSATEKEPESADASATERGSGQQTAVL